METNGFAVVFEDEFILVADKKSGLLVVPTPQQETRTLSSLINDYLKDKREQALPCHRLDRDTSGLIIYAKEAEVRRHIMQQFKEQACRKKYIAVVQGRVVRSRGVLKGYIRPKGKPAKFAVTKFKVLKRFKKFSIVEVEPKTGRTNQIRIHLCQLGHCVVGERKYTQAKRWLIRSKRLCLHAYFLQFRHPISGDTVTLTRDIPRELKDLLRDLGVEFGLRRWI